MTLAKALRYARRHGYTMVYRTSQAWFHRGILTRFDAHDHACTDWEVVNAEGSHD